MKSSCLIVDDSAICGSYESNRLDRVDIESADCIWSTSVDGSILASPLLINEKEAVICTLRGCVYKINVEGRQMRKKLYLGNCSTEVLKAFI